MSLTTQLLANDLAPIGQALEDLLTCCREAFFAVAYGTHRAYTHLDKNRAVRDFLNRASRLRTIFDVDRYFTDPALIDELCTVPGDVECRLYGPRIRAGAPLTQTHAFHPKVYYFQDRERAAAVIGSSNLSLGGLRNNREVGILLKGPLEHGVFRDLRAYLENIWSSPSLISVAQYETFRDSYRKAYQHARSKQEAAGLQEEVPIIQSEDELEGLQKAFQSAQNESSGAAAAYVFGLVSGGGRRVNLRRREVEVMLRRGILNRGKAHEGELFFEGVSERNLRQTHCVARDAERILTRVRTSFQDVSTGDKIVCHRVGNLSHRIVLRFSKASGIWKALRAELRANRKPTGQYAWPVNMPLTVPQIRRAFLQGYMDIRTRITAADALPRPKSYMRIAVSVGGKAPDFSEKLRDLMAEEFGSKKGQIGLSKGGPRGREDLIRIEATRLPPDFLRSPWQRIVLSDFQEYNKRLDLV